MLGETHLEHVTSHSWGRDVAAATVATVDASLNLDGYFARVPTEVEL
jgi:hypothetical protein